MERISRKAPRRTKRCLSGDASATSAGIAERDGMVNGDRAQSAADRRKAIADSTA